MTGFEIILNFEKDKAYLIPDKALSFSNLDLPEIIMSFKTKVSWLIKIINYKADEKLIFAEVINYFDSELEFTDFQLNNPEMFSNIDFINFRTINTSKLLRFIETEKADTTDYQFEYPDKEDFNIDISNDINIKKTKADETAAEEKPKDIFYVKYESFSIPIKEIRFGYGSVSFSKKIKNYFETIDFTIINYDIREEFDAIKNYFANILKTKRINVNAEIHFKNGELYECKASSPEIDRINSKTIDSVKFEFVGNFLKKKKFIDIDKSLFTMDDCFDLINEGKSSSNPFYNNDRDLFDDILQISDTKHYKHLRFLSARHAYNIMKLRFVLKPFSFIFLIEGEKMYHIVWETLDTEEATYIWHIDKNKEKLKLKLSKIEDIINIIKVQGKTAYINSYDDGYNRVFHDYSDFIDGFVKWKTELESFIN